MKTATLSEVKDQLSAYVDLVRSGERVRILVRGVPAADLVPVPATEPDAWLADLERRGVVERGTGAADDELLEPGPSVRGPAVSDALIEERRRR